MALKTFNLDADIYRKFSEHCKKNGISMSKKIENFLKDEIDKVTGVGRNVESNEATKIAHKSAEKTVSNHSMGKYC